MKFFNGLCSWLGLTAPPPPRPNALEISALRVLPIELIVQIRRFLPPESAACLAICCRPLFSALDTDYLEELRPMEGSIGLQRNRFLELLERDLPDYVICNFCKKFHAIDKARRYLLSNCTYNDHSECRKEDYWSLNSLYIHREFSSSIFKMTMKRYRQGRNCCDLLNLLSQKTRTYYRSGHVEQQTAAAKIIEGSLIIREQKRFLVPATQAYPIPLDACFVICRHSSVVQNEYLTYYLRSVQVSDWKAHKGYANREGVMRCIYCRTEFQIDFKQFGRKGNAMYVTRWLDLGYGPSSYDYRTHRHNTVLEPLRRFEFKTGSICTAFEGEGHFDYDSDAIMNPRDRKELVEKSWTTWLDLW